MIESQNLKTASSSSSSANGLASFPALWTSSNNNVLEHDKVAELQAEVENLKRQLAQSRAESNAKTTQIDSLRIELKRRDELMGNNTHLEDKLDAWTPKQANGTLGPQHGPPLPSVPVLTTSDKHGNSNVEEFLTNVTSLIQKSLFLDGGGLQSVKSLLSEYVQYCRKGGVPIDRLFAGFMTQPNILAYVWKWEEGQGFTEHEVPMSEFQPPKYNPKEPFAVLMKGKAMSYRMKAGDKNIPSGCAWFTQHNYQDYLALPFYQGGVFKGAVAWSTKAAGGFTEDQLHVLRRSLPPIATVVQCHCNVMLTQTLMHRLEKEINTRTSELAAANKSLEEANANIVKQWQSQLRNFAMMSHEIRTPLNCIVGLSNILLESDLDSSIQESIEMITSSGDLLLAVVDDVLDYSKLATGKVETKIQLTNIRSAIGAVVSSISVKAMASGLQLRTDISEAVPTMIETDGRRLQQVLYNLLGNAVKFGSRGKFVDFSVHVVEQAQPGQRISRAAVTVVQFLVKDYGKGIRPADREEIFEPFHQASNCEQLHGGTGLGLAITRQLVRVLGGSISVKSSYGSWCEFCIQFPCTQGARRESSQHVKGPDGDEDDYSTSSDAGNSSVISNSSAFESFLLNESKTILGVKGPPVATPVHSPIPRSAAIKFSPVRGAVSPATPPSLPRHFVPDFPTPPRFAGSPHSPGRKQATEVSESEHSAPSKEMAPAPSDRFGSIVDKERIVEKPAGACYRKPVGAEVSKTRDTLEVLIAEDNTINQKVLDRALRRIGLKNIAIVDNGRKAVDATCEKPYDIVFMDLQMPIMDGLEATSIISNRRNERQENFPAIYFLTAHALADYQEKAANSGADGFISKPFKLEVLRQLIAEIVGEDG